MTHGKLVDCLLRRRAGGGTLVPLERGQVSVHDDRPRLRQGAFVLQVYGVASRWVCSGRPAARASSCSRGEREEISRARFGSSIREIARRLDRSCSTVSRGNRTSWWTFWVSSQPRRRLKHGSRPCVPNGCLLPSMCQGQKLVASKLILRWSPQQISGWLQHRIRGR